MPGPAVGVALDFRAHPLGDRVLGPGFLSRLPRGSSPPPLLSHPLCLQLDVRLPLPSLSWLAAPLGSALPGDGKLRCWSPRACVAVAVVFAVVAVAAAVAAVAVVAVAAVLTGRCRRGRCCCRRCCRRRSLPLSLLLSRSLPLLLSLLSRSLPLVAVAGAAAVTSSLSRALPLSLLRALPLLSLLRGWALSRALPLCCCCRGRCRCRCCAAAIGDEAS